MKLLRIPTNKPIICYDNVGIFSSPRVAWMLKYFGATNVRILNGGFKKWKAEGRNTVKSPPRAPMSSSRDGAEWTNEGTYDFIVNEPNLAITDINQVHRTAYYLSNKATNMQIIDARAPPRFNGEVDEPRKGVRSGSITGSKNVFFNDLINKDEGTFKSDTELAKIFLDKDIDTTVSTINSCGSGVTACVVDVALRMMGAEKSSVYDGSWTEYVSII